MDGNEEMKETVMDWLNGLAANCYGEWIIKLVQHINKCLNLQWALCRKLTFVVFSCDIKIIWKNKVFFCLQQNGSYLKNDSRTSCHKPGNILNIFIA
jgi:hypothetical protein